MQLHQLKPIHKPRKKRIVGRGGKKDTYSGRGTKGQKARESLNLKPLIRDLIKRYPKLRGHRQRSKIRIQKSVVLNLAVLEKNFKDEEKITPKTWLEKKLRIKILFVLGVFAVFRIMANIPIPGIDTEKLRDFFASNQVFGLLNLFSGGA